MRFARQSDTDNEISNYSINFMPRRYTNSPRLWAGLYVANLAGSMMITSVLRTICYHSDSYRCIDW